MSRLLEITNLHVQIRTHHGTVFAVRGINLYLEEQETLAIVGESGSGKSISVKSIMGLLPKNGRVAEGSILLEGRELTGLKEREMQEIRGCDISMIFQDPMASLNPTMTVGKQIVEVLSEHRKGMNRGQKKARAIELISLVGISNPEARYGQYPHQLSGGMRQRIVIAIALACDPKVLIADEPTTALDVTIQAQILDLMKELQKKMKTSIIIITHNLGVVANVADRVAVMYGGQLVETGGVREVFYQTGHPYTRGLLASIPKTSQKGNTLVSIPGTPPDLMDPPKGCPFAARCSHTMLVCREYPPMETDCGPDHHASCWLFDERARAFRQEEERGREKWKKS